MNVITVDFRMKTIRYGEFYCPNCARKSPYKLIGKEEKTRLLKVLRIRLKHSRKIVCKECFTGYPEEEIFPD